MPQCTPIPTLVGTGAISAQTLPSALPDRALPNTCPRCGCALGFVNLYVGGRGYLPYVLCQNDNPEVCDYRRRAQ